MLVEKLRGPISWSENDPEIDSFLDRLQGNILKFHGRRHAVNMFCRFNEGSRPPALEFLRRQIARMQSAKQQLLSAQLVKQTGRKDTTPFVAVFMTKAGYDFFEVDPEKQPSDPAFQAGMRAADLNDPHPDTWDSRLRDPHCMILVGLVGAKAAADEATDLLNQISQIAGVAGGQSGELMGNQYFNADRNGIENFGYVDGRSQPLILTEDFPGEAMAKWPLKPFPVDQFVVPDPAVEDASAYGSYYVFRQLEQDVQSFKSREDQVEKDTFINGDSAGVGRLESGTPFEITSNDGGKKPDITNDFLFSSDPPRCPHFAHIRKVNPRSSQTQDTLMIRRATTYGQRPHTSPEDEPDMWILDDEGDGKWPTGGVGLLFQSYQANLSRQFELAQKSANSAAGGGIDPIIGQASSALLEWPTAYGSAQTKSIDFYLPPKGRGSFVTLRGGGYFFAPSLPFLRGL